MSPRLFVLILSRGRRAEGGGAGQELLRWTAPVVHELTRHRQTPARVTDVKFEFSNSCVAQLVHGRAGGASVPTEIVVIEQL